MAKQVIRSIIMIGDIEQIYDVWAHLRNFPHFMENIASIQIENKSKSAWW